MIIRTIKLYNFGIYSGEQNLYPCAMQGILGQPVTLVGGYNGRGKTSLLEAVLLALYGNRSRVARERKQSYSSYLESLIHQGVKDTSNQSWVEVEFDLDIEDKLVTLKVRRAWQRGRTGDRLTVWINGIRDLHVSKNWDTYVEDLIPSAIAELFFFDGERISELAEADQTVESLQEAIRSLLGIEIVDRLIKDLSLVIRRNQKENNEDDIEKRVRALVDEHAQMEQRADRIKQSIASLNNQIIQTSRRQQELETKYLKAGGNLLESRDQLLVTRDEVKNRLMEIKAEIASVYAGASPLLLVQSQLAAIKNIVQEGQKIDQARMALPIIADQNKELIQQLEKMEFETELLNKIEYVLKKQREAISDSAKREQSITLSFIGAGQLDDLLSGQSSQLKLGAIDLLERFNNVEYELEQVERHLMVEVDAETTTRLLRRLSKVTVELTEQENEKSRLEKEHAALKNQISATENKIVRTSSEREGIEEAERTVKYATKVQEAYRDFRDKLTKKKINQLAESVFETFDILTHKTTLVNKIQVDPDTFRFSLWTSNGKEIPKARLSSGERQMLAIAILWGLGRVSGRKLPVIIDTPMGRLDSLHRMNFVEKYLPHASHQVIVLSTDTEIVDDYLVSLKPHIGCMYLLRYDEEKRSTEIIPGYFETVGVKK